MKKIKFVFKELKKDYRETMLEELSRLGYTPFQMLIATLLSSRTKDSATIPIVKKLFAEYNTPEKLLQVDDKKLEKIIFTIGFFRVKAKNVKKISQIVVEKFGGNIPETLEELTSMPGVGRKTANCILAYVFGKPAIAVDIHVHRISNRLGWVKTKTPEETEEA